MDAHAPLGIALALAAACGGHDAPADAEYIPNVKDMFGTLDRGHVLVRRREVTVTADGPFTTELVSLVLR